jgi:hypothetical protein
VRGWAKTLRGAAPAALFFAAASIVMTFPLVLHLILIRLIESHPFRHWSIAEFDLRGD